MKYNIFLIHYQSGMIIIEDIYVDKLNKVTKELCRKFHRYICFQKYEKVLSLLNDYNLYGYKIQFLLKRYYYTKFKYFTYPFVFQFIVYPVNSNETFKEKVYRVLYEIYLNLFYKI